MTPEDGSVPTLVEPTANVIDVTTDVDAPTTGVDVPDTPVPDEEPELQRELVFQLRDLEVRYSGHTAVREVDLDIAANEITAFIGPSGRRSTAEEQAWPLVFLNSPRASYIAGEALHTDAGFLGAMVTGQIVINTGR